MKGATMSSDAKNKLFDDNEPVRPRNPSVHFSSATDEWATLQSLFDELNAKFRFTIDVCALSTNAKCDSYFTPEMDGLTQAWKSVCWMNPPLWKIYRSVGPEGVRELPGGHYGRVSYPFTNGHEVVARVRHEGG